MYSSSPYTSQVIDTDGFNMKALYRRAQAFMGLQEYIEADMDLKKGLETEPDNRYAKTPLAGK